MCSQITTNKLKECNLHILILHVLREIETEVCYKIFYNPEVFQHFHTLHTQGDTTK